MRYAIFGMVLTSFIGACTTTQPAAKINQDTIQPGSKITMKGQEFTLHPGTLQLGDNFLDKAKDLDIKFRNRITIVSIVPSIDTAVCEEQTHQLGESTTLTPEVDRIVISRDLPMAQKRFAAESGLENIQYYSDYKDAGFGKTTGLLIKGPELLTRGVLVLDQKGVIRYMQFVPKVEELPDMEKAFAFAHQLGANK